MTREPALTVGELIVRLVEIGNMGMSLFLSGRPYVSEDDDGR